MQPPAAAYTRHSLLCVAPSLWRLHRLCFIFLEMQQQQQQRVSSDLCVILLLLCHSLVLYICISSTTRTSFFMHMQIEVQISFPTSMIESVSAMKTFSCKYVSYLLSFAAAAAATHIQGHVTLRLSQCPPAVLAALTTQYSSTTGVS